MDGSPIPRPIQQAAAYRAKVTDNVYPEASEIRRIYENPVK